MNTEMILGFVRHILTFGGGILASKGMIDASDVDTAIGAITALIGVVWSVWQKKKADDKKPAA